jgi:D-amino peptidase
MIRSDMEGVTGVVDMNQVIPGASEYSIGQAMYMHDLLAVTDGLLQNADDEVWIYDIHFYGRNTILGRLDPRIKVICGKPHYTPQNNGFLDKSFAGVILLGLHANAQQPDALLAHNYEHDIRLMSVNGLIVGEIGLEAFIAGEAGVPLVMVTGDSEGAREARELIPNVSTVVVKESLGYSSAVCYPPTLTGKWLKEGAARCADHVRDLSPFVMSAPVMLKLSFRAGQLLERLQKEMHNYQTGTDTFEIRGDSVTAAWEIYLRSKA